jgi:Fe-Mn family superoxide dismutase
MAYELRPLSCDPSSLDGLSGKLITSHYENNYGGAVKRLNAIRAQTAQLDWASTPGFTINGLKREELTASNSAFLHELYFDALGRKGDLRPGGLSVAFARDFGSFDRWHSEFTALAKAMGGGSGWALCSWSDRENRVINHWAADHTHLLGGATPILALDMYEHAYHLDYGANCADYVAAVMRNLDWDKLNARYAAAVARDSEGWSVPAAEVLDTKKFTVLDVRRAGAFKAAPDVIAGASWRDPERVQEWAAALPSSHPVVVYCVYGHEVGQSTASILRAKGIDARFLAGGLEAWKAAGLPTQNSPAAQ